MSSLRTYQALNNGLAILDGASGHISYAIGSTLGNVAVTGIVFQNIIMTSAAVLLNLQSAVYSVNFTNCTFKNLTLYPGWTMNFIVDGNFFNMTSCLLTGIDCAVAGNSRSLFGVSGTGTYTILNCVISLDKITTYLTTNVFRRGSGTCTVVLKNTIIYNTQGTTVNWQQGGGAVSVATITNCCHYNITGVPTATSSITSDPLFVDAPNANFSPRPTSPCINTGTL
jgi:hypothetical protein